MDYHLKGHPYVKAGIDTACWDILGKVCRVPIRDVTVVLFGQNRAHCCFGFYGFFMHLQKGIYTVKKG